MGIRSQREAAERAGISTGAWEGLESDGPSRESTLAAAERLFGWPTDYLKEVGDTRPGSRESSDVVELRKEVHLLDARVRRLEGRLNRMFDFFRTGGNPDDAY